MVGIDIAFFLLSQVIGLLLGLWLGGRRFLSRMHKDDVQKGDSD